MVDYYIRYVDMPSVTKGMTIEDSDGFFNIYINASLSAADAEEATNTKSDIWNGKILTQKKVSKKQRLCK